MGLEERTLTGRDGTTEIWFLLDPSLNILLELLGKQWVLVGVSGAPRLITISRRANSPRRRSSQNSAPTSRPRHPPTHARTPTRRDSTSPADKGLRAKRIHHDEPQTVRRGRPLREQHLQQDLCAVDAQGQGPEDRARGLPAPGHPLLLQDLQEVPPNRPQGCERQW